MESIPYFQKHLQVIYQHFTNHLNHSRQNAIRSANE